MSQTRTKSTDPERRIGVFKRIEDVPERYRLENHSAAYQDQATWEEFLTSIAESQNLSEYYFATARRASRRWKNHLSDTGRHHALATPADVDDWCEHLLSDMKLRTVYETYWIQLEQFYSWLMFHSDHPHVYHPVLMAAISYDSAGKIWEKKIRTGREAQP